MSTKGTKKEESYGRFDFMGTSKIWATISAITITASIILFVTKGFNFGIDFAGGTEVQVLFKDNVEESQVKDFLKTINMENAGIQKLTGEQKEYLVRFDERLAKKNEQGAPDLKATVLSITDGLKTTFGEEKMEVRRVDSVGPTIGDQLKRNSVLALFYGLLAILVYIALRFDYNYAPGAVLCLFHDAIVSLGILVLLNKEITVQTLAAILTLIGYSINDTIVVFDRIREDLHTYKDKEMNWVINRSMNSTLSRTIITSFLTFMSCLALYVWGTGVIQDFAFVMGIGIILGTYSTAFVAAPLIIVFDKFKTSK